MRFFMIIPFLVKLDLILPLPTCNYQQHMGLQRSQTWEYSSFEPAPSLLDAIGTMEGNNLELVMPLFPRIIASWLLAWLSLCVYFTLAILWTILLRLRQRLPLHSGSTFEGSRFFEEAVLKRTYLRHVPINADVRTQIGFAPNEASTSTATLAQCKVSNV